MILLINKNFILFKRYPSFYINFLNHKAKNNIKYNFKLSF